MDRRQKKTRKAIFDAFSKLLIKKNFNNITVQEIIDEANIGRSTFYSHFVAKDELLKEMCEEIFTHIFESTPIRCSSDKKGLKEQITHMLYHLKESKSDIKSIFCSESQDLYMRYFKEYLKELFSKYVLNMNMDISTEFALNHLIGAFTENVKWWVKNDMKEEPDKFANEFILMISF